ncbi:hypothetical protein ACFVT2_00510 [Streptomyces sp. NPDC058000]|uniref:hypothetical protein n=1 Tax=Streptomyces sp. NPDC058000 TaxID=3346299 RepID=UPI0036E4F419
MTGPATPARGLPQAPRRHDPAWRRPLSPPARARLATAFEDLAGHRTDVADALLSLARGASGDGHRDVLRRHGAEQRRHAEQCRRHAARLRDGAGPQHDAPGQLHEARPELPAVPPSPGTDWYAGLVTGYLAGGGVLVPATLGTLRDAAREACAPAPVADELAAMARADAAHLTHALAVVRDGVRSGHADTVVRAHGEAVDATVRALVDPGRRVMTPMVPVALAQRARALSGRWDEARERIAAHLALIGLAEHAEEARRRWDAARDGALAEYRDRHGTPHFVQRAVAAGLLPAPSRPRVPSH